jgi:hypothetical protein
MVRFVAGGVRVRSEKWGEYNVSYGSAAALACLPRVCDTPQELLTNNKTPPPPDTL